MKNKDIIFPKVYLLEEYINKLCDAFDENIEDSNRNLFLKASSEFALLCSVYKKRSDISPSISDTCKKIENRLMSENYNLKNIIGIKSLLKFIGTSDLVTYSEYDHEIRRLNKRKNNLAMEEAFYIEVSNIELNNNYWELAALEIFKIALEAGLTDELFYQITHLVMFGTQMGSRSLFDVCSIQTINICEALLAEMETHAINRKYWDLLLEVYLSQVYIQSGISITKNEMMQSLQNIPSINGYFLPFGEDLENFRSNIENPYSKSTYKLYHTTLIGCLLFFELEQFQRNCSLGISQKINSETRLKTQNL